MASINTPELNLDINYGKINISQTDEDSNKDEIINPIPHRIFINHLDSFLGKHLSTFLADQIFGAAKKALSEEEGLEEAHLEEEINQELEKNNETKVKYEIVGTNKYTERNVKSEDVTMVLSFDNSDFYNEILNCGVIIFDITRDEEEIPTAYKILQAIEQNLEKIKEQGPKTYENSKISYIFILISTVMTWALTKPLDPDDPEIPFTETDYKKRKPHPNYKNHIALEREIKIKSQKYKNKLKALTLCSGITYGDEEDELLFLFKMAWKNEKEMPVFLPGKNKIPCIHVKDLVKIVHLIIENFPRKPYILAVEQVPSTLKNIVKNLAKAMGKGYTKDVTPLEAFLLDEVNQNIFDRCTVNLLMEPGVVVDELEIEWQSEEPLAENMKKIVSEFKKAWGLTPLKIILHGPPAVGKTRLAKRLVENYGIRYINVKSVIDETIANLQEKVNRKLAKIKAAEEKQRLLEEAGETEENEEAEEEEEEDEEEEGDIEEWQEEIKDIEAAMNESEDGKLPDDYLIKLMKNILLSNQSQNQGFVLDGYPKSLQQTKLLFGGGGEEGEEEEPGEEEEEGDGNAPPTGKQILPGFIVSLQATDEFLCERIMQLPEKDIQGTHYTEEGMLRRLATFRSLNTEDNTFLNYFDEIEIHPILIDVMDDPSENMDVIYEIIRNIIGDPIGFGLTPEEEIELKCQKEAELLECENENNRKRMEQESIAKREYETKMEEWANLQEEYEKEEEKILIAQAEPLRHYLIKYVFPTLIRGLLQVANLKPADPIDFLAEYLFKENPEGKMFDPSYTEAGEALQEKFKKRSTMKCE